MDDDERWLSRPYRGSSVYDSQLGGGDPPTNAEMIAFTIIFVVIVVALVLALKEVPCFHYY